MVDVTLIRAIFEMGAIGVTSFYRAMHFSAKRGIAIACRLSGVRSVSVRL